MRPTPVPGLYIGFDEAGTPRYVGIAHADVDARARHLTDKRSDNPKIEAHKANGHRLEVRVLRMPGIDEAALATLETSLIRAIGREDEGTGPLWNLIAQFGVFPKDIRYARAKVAARTGKRRRAGKKASLTKGPAERAAAAVKAAKTRARNKKP